MGYRGAALTLALLGSVLPCRAQVPAQASALVLRGIRATDAGTAVAFEVLDGRGRAVPGVRQAEVTARVDGRPVGLRALERATPIGAVWVLDATRRARMERFAETQQAFALWADSLRRGGEHVAVVAAGRPPRRVLDWSVERTKIRAAVDNLSPRDDEADLAATLQLAAETCRSLPVTAARCAVIFATDARDAATSSAQLDSSAAVLTDLGVPVYALLLGSASGEGASGDALARLVRASKGAVVRGTRAEGTLRTLRQRLATGQVAFLDGVPTGRPAMVALTVQTADGRTLQDSMTVRLDVASVTDSDSTGASQHAPSKKGGNWLRWLGLLSALVAGGVAWLFFGRKRGQAEGGASRQSPAPSDAVMPASQTTTDAAPAGADARVAPASAPAGGAAIAPSGAPPLRLVLRPLRSGAAEVPVEVAARVTLGRASAQADVVVEGDPAISATHAVLERHGDRVLLRDLDSTNGTSVNGVPVQGTVVLDEGDVLRLGKTDLRVHFDAPPSGLAR